MALESSTALCWWTGRAVKWTQHTMSRAKRKQNSGHLHKQQQCISLSIAIHVFSELCLTLKMEALGSFETLGNTEQQSVIWQWTWVYSNRAVKYKNIALYRVVIIQSDSGGNVKCSVVTIGYCDKQKFIRACVLLLIGYGDTAVWIYNYKSIVNGVFVLAR